ncbi:UNVERIFIED_CONTAM: hypothetical protein Slati_3638100 [Sesamum latifolium]|uniref:Retrotransposon Copia-like N-terminal domain-containing protein n=1 Tax=Sesamum latifolium TaxID=2727402 RepID=A0AAW2U0C1_9LAMI
MAEESEVMRMQGSENPGMALVSTLLDRRNYLSWSRSIKLALGAKMKLGYINAYSTKLKKLWDELTYISPIPSCQCGTSKAMADLVTSNQLMQFLMELHDSYDHERNQIMMMDPLPSVSRAFSMILRVEKQREVNSSIADSILNVAMQTRGFTRTGYRELQRRKDKQGMTYEKCGKTSNLKETCFEIHGYPEWYKALVEKRKQITNTSTSRALNTIKEELENSIVVSMQNPPDKRTISEIIRNESRGS